MGGGIGIAALVPFLARHCDVRSCWSARETAGKLVDEVCAVLAVFEDKDVRIGGNVFNPSELIEQEARPGWKSVRVVVSGLAGMCNYVRTAIIVEVMRNTTIMRFKEIGSRGILLVNDPSLAVRSKFLASSPPIVNFEGLETSGSLALSTTLNDVIWAFSNRTLFERNLETQVYANRHPTACPNSEPCI